MVAITSKTAPLVGLPQKLVEDKLLDESKA